MTEDVKPWWKSKGVNGALFAIGGTLGGMIGINVDEALIQDAIGLGEQAYVLVMQGIALGGAALALWGRFTAKSKIK